MAFWFAERETEGATLDVEEFFEPAGEDAVVLTVHVQPGAGRTAVVGRHGPALKVKVGAPPEGGRANQACATLLAETFGAKAAQVELVSGAQSRVKRFRLAGLDREEFRRRLERAVADGGRAPGAGPERPDRAGNGGRRNRL